jgi:hypothetical protein
MIQLSVSLTPPSEVIVGAQFPMHKTAANIEEVVEDVAAQLLF